MADQGLRARVKRLLDGDVRTDDIARLFLYARDRCDGRESVREIGDFVAHNAERTKGIITREVRDWFAVTNFIIPHLGAPISPLKIPPTFPEFLRASFRRVDNLYLRRNVQLNRADARRLLASAIAKLNTNPDGTVAITQFHSDIEKRLLKALCSLVVARPAFDEFRLFEDFAATLKSHALVHKNELRALAELRPVFSLFAVSVMHNCVIDLGGGQKSQLQVDVGEQHIRVNAATPAATPKGGLLISSSIFETHLDPVKYCKPELLAMKHDIKCDVELATPDILLSPLV